MDRLNRVEASTLNAETNACIHIVGKSVIGTRQSQQDAFYIGRNGNTCLAVICDGMGGTEHGEMASQCAVEILARDYTFMQYEENPYVFLRKEAIKIDEAVSMLKDEFGQVIDSGTTIVALIAKDNKVWWLSVGDSRIYIIRKNQFSPVTREHNYGLQLAQQLNNNDITQVEYQSEMKNAEALISYIGMNGIELIDQNNSPFEMRYMDRFLLCSDGLVKALGEEHIKEILLKHPLNIDASMEELLTSVEQCGKKHIDNTTAVLLSYE